MEKSAMYLKAARIVAKCPRSKLQQVMALLKEAGVEIDATPIQNEDNQKRRSANDKRAERRKNEYGEDFWKADNDFLQIMRDAYAEGISFTQLSRLTGLSRVSLYRYLHGEFTPCESDMDSVLKGIEELRSQNVAKFPH